MFSTDILFCAFFLPVSWALPAFCWKHQILFYCFGNLFHFPSLHENPNLSRCRVCSSYPNIQKAGAEPHPLTQGPTAVCFWAIHCSRESTNWQLCQTMLTHRRTGSEWVATRTIYSFSHKIPTSVEICNPLTTWIFFPISFWLWSPAVQDDLA